MNKVKVSLGQRLGEDQNTSKFRVTVPAGTGDGGQHGRARDHRILGRMRRRILASVHRRIFGCVRRWILASARRRIVGLLVAAVHWYGCGLMQLAFGCWPEEVGVGAGWIGPEEAHRGGW